MAISTWTGFRIRESFKRVLIRRRGGILPTSSRIGKAKPGLTDSPIPPIGRQMTQRVCSADSADRGEHALARLAAANDRRFILRGCGPRRLVHLPAHEFRS